VPSPGMKYRHYAPNVPVFLFRDVDELPPNQDLTVIALDGLAPTLSGKPNIIFISLGADQHSAAVWMLRA